MPTANSSAEPLAELRRGASDAWLVLGFRRSLGSPRLRCVVRALLAVTVLLVVVPALLGPPTATLEGTLDGSRALAWAWLAFPILAASASVATGGGRELLPAEQAVAFPIGPPAEYAGSILLAPLNIAWLLQTWSLLALTSLVTGRIVPSAALVLAWVVLGTVVGQAVGWSLEWVRRSAGAMAQRLLLGLLGAGLVLLVLDDVRRPSLADPRGLPGTGIDIGTLLDAASTGTAWLLLVPLLLVVATLIALLGAYPAGRALALPRADEERLDSERHPPRTTPRSDAAMLVRIDRGSLWRTVPFRRGLLLLAALPVVGALAGAAAGPVPWTLVVMVPGLVASGVALLFGVNAWSLDGRGVLWRASLPVEPGPVFGARMRVIAEASALAVLPGVLLVGTVVALRTGMPSAGTALAVAGAWLSTSGQVLSACARWSLARPYAVDLRSARATPAPPAVMVGYAARLSVATSLTGLLFAGLAVVAWWPTVAVTLVLVAWSTLRVRRARRRWLDPQVRSRVLVAVAG